MEEKDLVVLLNEKRVFKPSKKLVENSNVMKWMKKKKIKSYDELLKKAEDIEWFWNEAAKETVKWKKPFKKILEQENNYSKWFNGAKYNIVFDALDKHKNKTKTAFIWEGEPEKEVRKISFKQLYQEVNKLANAMKKLGIKKGDRIGIYLPMIPELPVAMLASAKIGAIHSVVFSGFSALAFRERVNDEAAKLVITCDGFYRRGKIIPLKKAADEALMETPSVEKCIVIKRTAGEKVDWNEKRDLWYHEIIKKEKPECKTELMEANDPLFILYTSGTTGKPKGIIHDHGGYAVGTAITLKWVFDLKDKDIWWCAADIGWITGHSYIVYAPLILGVTSVMYEGSPDFPNPDRWWEIIDKHKVTVLYTSPTAIRMFMHFGEEWIEKHSLKSLRLLGSVGEPINPEAWMWYYKFIGKEKCQIMDTWWQTETGNHCITPLPITDLKPGSATKPFPGIQAKVLNKEGKEIINAGGELVLLKPWPGMLKGIYKNPEKYQKTYWEMYPEIYLAGDVARVDSDGYFWVQGRDSDVLKVSGHRIGNSEIESALVSHPLVAEAAAIGKPHEIKGESITAFVILKKGTEISENLRKELIEHVGKEIGKLARPDEILFVEDLPKTRSGKIMRRVIKAKVLGQDTGNISTLSNPEAVEELLKAK
ncbi:MAG: acetate--CoA ligase [Candidatus Diapherotrites archaeon CG10_big_fil_rev_8_21_14_0_10_31_34]|nr:MAG: acetate--CoA ligase [Candidatus Diapherotrites archaeon CG10_big_fil_rev_8_21_14_0_10_31_34]